MAIHIVILDPATWLFTVIPILSIIGVVYALVCFAFWRTAYGKRFE